MAAVKKPTSGGFVVTAPLVQVVLGNRAVQYYGGDVLPEGVPAESLAHLKSLGFIEELQGAEPESVKSDDEK